MVKILVPILIYISYFVFKDIWIDIFDKLIVTPFASRFSPSPMLLIPCILNFIIYGFFWYYEKKHNMRRRIIITIFSITYLTFLYLGEWIYVSFYLCSIEVYYSHIILLPALGELILLVKETIQKKSNKDDEVYKGLEFELPIESIDAADIYGRNTYTTSISKKLSCTFKKESSFVVGISGGWGTGKTSFTNILIQNIKQEVDIVIEFKPWFSSKADDILKDFFSLYIDRVKIYYPELSKTIPQYVEALIDSSGSKHSKVFNLYAKELFTKDAQTYYDKIKAILSTKPLKTVVVIDDLDRLNKSEILEVFKLVRNIANLPNILFVVTYDKDYILGSLSEIPNADKYLHKIFNLEITLPKYETITICTELKKRLTSFFNTYEDYKSNDNIIWDFCHQKKDTEFIIPVLLPTLRDVIRFSNAIELNISTFNNSTPEINVSDLMTLELIRYSNPEIFEVLRTYPLSILNIKDNYYSYTSKKDDKLIIDPFIKYNKVHIEFIDYLLTQLFFTGKNTHSIVFINSYFKYFAYRLEQGALPIPALFQLIGKEHGALELFTQFNQINEGEIYDKITYLLNLLKDNQTLIDKTSKFIKDLILLENQYIIEILLALRIEQNLRDIISISELLFYLDIWAFSLNYFITHQIRIDNNQILMSILYRNNLETIVRSRLDETLKSQIKNQLLKSSSLHIISISLSIFIEDHVNGKIEDTNLVFTIDELREIQFEMFKIHVDSGAKKSNNTIILFEKCIDTIDPNTYKVKIRKDALELMQETIKGEPEFYFENFVRIGVSSADDINTIFPDPFIEQIFGSYEEFEKFILNQKLEGVSKINRVRNLWSLYKNNSYQGIEIRRQGKIVDIIENDFKVQIEKLEKLKNLEDDVLKFKADWIENKIQMNEAAFDDKINMFRSELREIILYITLNGDIDKIINSVSFDKSY